jgi:hypothetical protein
MVAATWSMLWVWLSTIADAEKTPDQPKRKEKSKERKSNHSEGQGRKE